MKNIIKICVTTLLLFNLQQLQCAQPQGNFEFFGNMPAFKLDVGKIEFGVSSSSLLAMTGLVGSIVSIKLYHDGIQKRVEENKLLQKAAQEDCAGCQKINAPQERESSQLFTYGSLLLVGSLAAIFNGQLLSLINGK